MSEMKDSPLWPFGSAHPDNAPYVMAACPCLYCRDHAKGVPDTAVVWSYEDFKRELLNSKSSVKFETATKETAAFQGVRIVEDKSLAPGTVELRSGKEVVRVINLAPSEP